MENEVFKEGDEDDSDDDEVWRNVREDEKQDEESDDDEVSKMEVQHGVILNHSSKKTSGAISFRDRRSLNFKVRLVAFRT